MKDIEQLRSELRFAHATAEALANELAQAKRYGATRGHLNFIGFELANAEQDEMKALHALRAALAL